MVNFKVILLICGVIVAGYGSSGDNVSIDPEPDHSNGTYPPQPTSPPNITTTVAPNITTTTVTPKTTTTSTTTLAPNTTTVAPNTTTVTPFTTTAKPTTPAPTPAPVDPMVANWTVNYAKTNRSCIVLFVAAQFEVLADNETVKVNVPVDATASGSCENNRTQTLEVSWGVNNSLEFNFEKTNSSKFDLDNIVSTLNVSLKTGPKVFKLVHKSPEFLTPLENSYKCARTQSLNLTEDNSNTTVAYLRVSHLQYQAFRNSTEHKFDSALDCESSVTPDIVPIVVGCVLALLVVAVLVAYLFGRRRCQARGYLSMFEQTRREEDYIPMKNLSCFN